MPQDKGLILNPTKGLNVDAYLDANIARLCRDKDGADLHVYEAGQDLTLLLLISQCSGSLNCRQRLLY